MTILVYGASGAIGGSISSHLENRGEVVFRLSTREGVEKTIFMDPSGNWKRKFNNPPAPFSVVFAQGLNVNDDIFDLKDFAKVLEANLIFIAQEISSLLRSNYISTGSSIVVLSSVWQDFSRQKKFSYTVSKSAIQGLVNSLVADLSPLGIRINAVLPGVVDSPMTREMLKPQILERIITETPFGKLVDENNIAEVVQWLLSTRSLGVVGQFIRVDNGWTNVRLLP